MAWQNADPLGAPHQEAFAQDQHNFAIGSDTTTILPTIHAASTLISPD